MSGVVFHPGARDEYREAIRYYYEINPELQEGFRQEVRKQITRIVESPLLYNVRRYGVRRANLDRFGLYYIAYMIWREQVVIIAVGHARRKPYYWYRRPKEFREQYR